MIPVRAPYSYFLYGFTITHVIFRLTYLFYLGGILKKRTSMPKEKKQIEAWKQFKSSASFVLNLDAELFFAASLAGSWWGQLHEAPAILRMLPIWAWFLTGTVLIIVGGLVKWNAYQIIGDRGWYWYNFFCPPEQTDYEAEGVYRFLDNPMYGVGYLPLFGISIFLLSPLGFMLALFDWVAIWTFYYLYEHPHTINVLEEQHL